MKKSDNHRWAIILAAGEGVRLKEFLRERYGLERPKQFSTIVGTRSMLRHTLNRARRLVSLKKIRTVVCKPHLSFVLEELTEKERHTLLVLPCPRETACSILVPALAIGFHDPSSLIACFPSDHFVLQEDRFIDHVEEAMNFVELYPQYPVLLGMYPTDPDPDYGWIEPSRSYLTSEG